MKFVIILLFLFALVPCDARDNLKSQPPLVLDKVSGEAPLSVTIVGPTEFASELSNWDGEWKKWGGAGFSVDWGDGVTEPTYEMRGSRRSLTQHKYAAAGTYTITASTFHLGPTDGRQIDWCGTATVTVKSAVSVRSR